jgi:hypothetical protein
MTKSHGSELTIGNEPVDPLTCDTKPLRYVCNWEQIKVTHTFGMMPKVGMTVNQRGFDFRLLSSTFKNTSHTLHGN